jgi:MGT family glycosyltransferase
VSRFLVATVPVPAHSRNPLPMVARLVARGHEVVWFAGRRFHDGITAVGATPVPYRTTRDYDGERLLSEFPELGRLAGPRAIGWAYAELFVGEAPRRVADLEPVLDASPVDAVLCDALSYGVGLLAQSRGIPWATFGDGPLARAHGTTPAFGPGLLPMRGPVSRLRNHAVREATRRWVFADARARHDRLRGAMGLPADGLDVLQAGVSPMLHLQACTPSFEYPAPGLPATVHWVGALRPDPPTSWVPPDWWDEVRAPTRPVVHVTQGSIRPDMRELVVPTLRALARDDVLVVVTTGGVPRAELEARYGGPLPGNTRVSEYIPYDLLLPHVDVCVTNGGYTGVTTALHHGVPLVQAGSTEEKAEIGARVAWSGVGVRIRATRPSPPRLRAAVRRVLRDPRHRVAAQRMGAELRRHDAAEEGADLLERLADTGAPVTEPVTPARAR